MGTAGKNFGKNYVLRKTGEDRGRGKTGDGGRQGTGEDRGRQGTVLCLANSFESLRKDRGRFCVLRIVLNPSVTADAVPPPFRAREASKSNT